MNIHHSGSTRLAWFTAAFFAPAASLFAAFGVVTDLKCHTVDTGAGLVFQVQKTGGSINSIKLNGTELNTTKASGIDSGLGSNGTSTSVRSDANTIVITVTTDDTNMVVSGLTHYYIARKGENAIYMATHATHEPANGELRWITRLQNPLLPGVPNESNIANSKGAIESKDVFGLGDGTTRSKYYGNQQARHLTLRGVTGPGRGVFMAYGSRESSAGGAFFRDIQNQTGSTTEVYNYMNSGHNQTETWRTGVLYGPYALLFTNGAIPTIPNMGFIAGLGIKGHVDIKGRGEVVLSGIKGLVPNHAYTVGFANSTAQYWTNAATSNGAAACKAMKPGTYAMTIYKGEIGVFNESVTVTAGQPTILEPRTITEDPSSVASIWRIGDWDGTPLEFRNGTNIPRMHPSDKRQANWRTGPFVVGRSGPADFPACQWRDVNDNQVVAFQLGASQIADHTIRIGTTAAYSGGRPKIKVNSWNSSLPAAPSQPDSRSITIGTYRGNNTTYTFMVPSKAFVQGTNTLTIQVVSGKSGSRFLSPGYAIDCIDFN